MSDSITEWGDLPNRINFILVENNPEEVMRAMDQVKIDVLDMVMSKMMQGCTELELVDFLLDERLIVSEQNGD